MCPGAKKKVLEKTCDQQRLPRLEYIFTAKSCVVSLNVPGEGFKTCKAQSLTIYTGILVLPQSSVTSGHVSSPFHDEDACVLGLSGAPHVRTWAKHLNQCLDLNQLL